MVVEEYPRGEIKCVCGSGITTRLRCSRCGKPICYECMVESPVGYRCPSCSSGPRIAAYSTSSILLLKTAVVGVALAIAIGFFWGNFPRWGFFMALIMGFGVVEAMAKAATYKRGSDLQFAAYGAMAIGIMVSRYTITLVNPDNIPFNLTIQFLFDNIGNEAVRSVFYLQFPDFLFMAIPFVIAYIRFR